MKSFNFENSLRTENNINLFDDKFTVTYLNADDIVKRFSQVFKEQSTEYIQKLAEDIKVNGLDNPLIVRHLIDGKYDLICGRHRFLALKLLGETKIPCIIQKLTDDEADIKLINSNLNQRHNYLPSELALAYRKKKEILEKKLDTKNVNVYEELARDTQYSSKTIRRYLQILALIPPFVKMVDEKKLDVRRYTEVIKLSAFEQNLLYNIFINNKLDFKLLDVSLIKYLVKNGINEEDVLSHIKALKEEKNSKKKKIFEDKENERLTEIFNTFEMDKFLGIELLKNLEKQGYIKLT